MTAGHYHSLKLGKTVPGRNASLRCYVTGTGSSTVEVRTDGLQADDNGVERLGNVCHTIMVALDALWLPKCIPNVGISTTSVHSASSSSVMPCRSWPHRSTVGDASN